MHTSAYPYFAIEDNAVAIKNPLPMHFVSDVAFGVGIGLTLGLTGGGGSIVTLPVLVYGLGQAVHPAIGTSLAIVGGIATLGAVEQRRCIRVRTSLLLAGCGLLGAIPGSAASQFVPGHVLLLAFALVAAAAGVLMLRGRKRFEAADTPAAWPFVAGCGLGLGLLTGFLGVGGGFLIVPTLVCILGIPMRAAIATSLFIIALNSTSGLAVRALSGDIAWPIVAAFVIGGALGNAAGAALARHVDQAALRRVFAGFVLLVAAFTGAGASGLLPSVVK